MCPWTGCDPRRSGPVLIACLALAAVLSLAPATPGPALADRGWGELEARLAADGLDSAYVRDLFARSLIRFDPAVMARKMNALLRARASALTEDAGPAREVLSGYLNPILLARAYVYMIEHRGDFERAAQRYGVPLEVLAAVLLVETKTGMIMGDHPAWAVLANMAACRDMDRIRPYLDTDQLPGETLEWLKGRLRDKADWAYRELKALIGYARANGQDPLDITGSVFGAIGLCQFVPTTAVRYGVDGDGDGRVDLFKAADALFSIGNFLKRHGWTRDLDEDGMRAVLFRYNHSEAYARTILAVADKLRGIDRVLGGGQPPYSPRP